MAEEGNLITDTSISCIVQLALDKLFSCLESRVGLLLDDGDEAEKIKCSLYTILKVIGCAEERPLKDQFLIDWLEKLKEAAYDAEDILDEYATEDLRRKVEAQNSKSVRDPVTNKVRKISSSLSTGQDLNRKMMTRKLKGIRKRLESLEKQRHKFQLSERDRKWEHEFKEHRQTYSFVPESEVYGRHEDKEKMVNLLLCAVAGHEDENVSVIPIVGIGGLGKTMLAQLLFNDDRVQKHFQLKMWVCVSDDFNVRRIMKKIIERATRCNISDESDLEELQHRVQEALNGRRFLLVLDDVWNEKPEKWNRLRVLLMREERGSRIVVTTRSPMIASIMSRIEPHHLQGLSEEDCWKLFASLAFHDRRGTIHPNMIKIGKDIVRKCRGVPLAVITLGGLLSFKKEESQWVFVRDSDLWNLAAAEQVHGILPALKLSYFHLNPHLRLCFAFCAIFPKDYNMDKELLIKLWMAHGCVPSKSGQELEDIGIQILNELLNRSLFQEVKEYFDGVDYFLSIKVHDLVHDLAQSVMGNDCCVIEGSVNISKMVRHLSFHRIDSPFTPIDSLYEAESLRTLVVLPYLSKFAVPLDVAIFKSLRVLDLRYSRVDNFPLSLQLALLTSLGELIHLRYLGLADLIVETLPESICNLQNLQTLKLYRCGDLRELPKGTRNLINLRCLDTYCCGLRRMPTKIGMLSCLRELPLFVVGDTASDCSGIEELQCLNLRGNLQIRCLENVAVPSNAQRANLIGKSNLDRLELRWIKLPYVPWDNILAAADNTLEIEAEEEVLKGLQPHENLKGLEIFGYGGFHFPSWMTGFLLPNIVELSLQDCSRCEILPPLGQLPSLRFLRISSMKHVENIGNEFYGNDMSEGFPSLDILEIGYMYSLKAWSGLHGGRILFPRLVKLRIEKCPKLTTIACFPCLTALQTLSSLQILIISDCAELKSLPEEIGNLSSLKGLELDTSGVTSLPRGIGDLSSLETLHLWQLESLTSLPESMQELSTLTELSIRSCPQLPSLPEWVGDLTALQDLVIDNCPQMMSLPVGLQRLTRLQRLNILRCPELQRRCEETGQDYVSSDKFVNLY